MGRRESDERCCKGNHSAEQIPVTESVRMASRSESVDAGVDPNAAELKGRKWAERNSPSVRGKEHIIAEKVQVELDAQRFLLLAAKPPGGAINRVSLKPKNALDPRYDEGKAEFQRMVIDCTFEGKEHGCLRFFCFALLYLALTCGPGRTRASGWLKSAVELNQITFRLHPMVLGM